MAQVTPDSKFFLNQINEKVNNATVSKKYFADVFPEKGITTGFIQVDLRTEGEKILPILSRYAQSPSAGTDISARKYIDIAVPKIPVREVITPQDVDGVRSFGEMALQTMEALVDEKMVTARNNLEATLEYMRAHAMQGVIIDHNGDTLLDLYSAFGVSKVTVDFALGTTTTKVLNKCLEVSRAVEDGLLGDSMTSIEVPVSPEFFDKLISHANVEKAYAGYAEAALRMGTDMRSGFTFGGLKFVEHRESINGSRLITAGRGVAFPRGTTNTFRLFVAPPALNGTVNKLGRLVNMLPIKPMDNGEGYSIIGQSCPLPVCLRPLALIDVHTSN